MKKNIWMVAALAILAAPMVFAEVCTDIKWNVVNRTKDPVDTFFSFRDSSAVQQQSISLAPGEKRVGSFNVTASTETNAARNTLFFVSVSTPPIVGTPGSAVCFNDSDLGTVDECQTIKRINYIAKRNRRGDLVCKIRIR